MEFAPKDTSLEQNNAEGIDEQQGFRLHSLWPIPVYENVLAPFNKNWLTYAIENADYERMHTNNGDITVNRYILDLPEFADLKQQVYFHLNVLMRNYFGVKPNAEFYLQNSWINRHHKDDFGQIHNHQNSLMSGCLYLGVTEKTGGIRFYKGLAWTNLLPISVSLEYEKFNHINASYYTITPKQGSIVLFPSHLEHCVEKNNDELIRYSLAFNFYVRGNLGREEYELNLR
jgi:uncharacterized protein (TIGR02466 family)